MDWTPEEKLTLKRHKDNPFDVAMTGILLFVLIAATLWALAPALVF